MALATAFQRLFQQLDLLRSSLEYLRIHLEYDAPAADGIALAEGLTGATIDVLGWVDGAVKGAMEGRAATTASPDSVRALTALAATNEALLKAQESFAGHVHSLDVGAQLGDLSRLRGEWRGWVQTVLRALDDCQRLFTEASSALYLAWVEVAERGATTAASVSATAQAPNFLERRPLGVAGQAS